MKIFEGIFGSAKRARPQTEDDYLHQIIDMLMADVLVMRAIHTELLKRIALQETQPDRFVREFIDGVHSRIDYHARQMSQPSPLPQAHDLALKTVDSFGSQLLIAVTQDR